MKLTEQEIKDAERAKLISQLEDHDLAIMTECKRVSATIDAAYAQQTELQDLCNHPLVARVTKNDGSTGNWDQNDLYWTDHRREICDRRWTTTQRWKHVGGKLGLPDDEIAKDWDK